VENPEKGKLIQGSGGLRKIRWAIQGRGKSGGLRIIYYFYPPSQIFMLVVYKKGSQEDLSSDQLKFLKHLIREYLP
jgi:hypothetical protein